MLTKLEMEPIPEAVKAAIGKTHHTPEAAQLRKELPKWTGTLEHGVCSPCVWQYIVGSGDTQVPKVYLEEMDDIDAYRKFVQRMYDSCAGRGADWLGGVPYGGDDVIWRIEEADGKVYRYIEDSHKYSRFKGRWHRAEEGREENASRRECREYTILYVEINLASSHCGARNASREGWNTRARCQGIGA